MTYTEQKIKNLELARKFVFEGMKKMQNEASQAIESIDTDLAYYIKCRDEDAQRANVEAQTE